MSCKLCSSDHAWSLMSQIVHEFSVVLYIGSISLVYSCYFLHLEEK